MKLFSLVFMGVYTVAWYMAWPFLKWNKRLRDGWTQRLAHAAWTKPVDVWIQAASGGEAYLALEIIRLLPSNVRVLCCTWTRQGHDILSQGIKDIRSQSYQGQEALCPKASNVQVCFAPLDVPSIAARALAQARPRLMVLLETEIWPGLLLACAKARVPVFIVNGRLSRTSLESYRLLGSLLRSFPIEKVLAISKEDARRFRLLLDPAQKGQPQVDTMSNIKFDRAVASLHSGNLAQNEKNGKQEHRPPSEINQALNPHKVVLLASVRKQEESLLLPQIKALQEEFPQAMLVVAPRHLHRVRHWLEALLDMGIPALASSKMLGLSKTVNWQCAWQISANGDSRPLPVVVWDSFGDLQELYSLSHLVFVGGSLAKCGGQNFLEPLAAGRIPCVGTYLENFRWALGEDNPPGLSQSGLLDVCTKASLLPLVFRRRAAQKVPRDHVKEKFEAWMRRYSGGTAQAVQIIMQKLG